MAARPSGVPMSRRGGGDGEGDEAAARGEGGEDLRLEGDGAAGGDVGEEVARQEVEAGVDEAGAALGFFAEGGDEAVGVGLHGAVAAGILDGGHEDFSTAWKLFFHGVEKTGGIFHGVENFFPQCGKLEAGGEGVAVEDEDGVGGKQGLDELQRAAGAEGLGLPGKDDFQSVGVPRGEIGLQHVGHVAGGEEDVRDAVLLQPVELPFEERPAGDGHEAFGPVGEPLGDARALSPQQNDGLRNHGRQDAKRGGRCQTAASPQIRRASV